jgi:tryptophan 2,3-dioxygenase
MTDHLQHKQGMLLASLLAGKLPRNLSWNEVVELMGKLGEVQPHEDNEVEFVIGSQRAFFKRPHTHSLEVDEVSRLRRLLHEARLGATPKKSALRGRIVVVIDHHMARIYQDLGGSRPERENAMKPYDPHGFHRYLIHRKEAHYEGQRVPEETSFYEEIAEDLKPAKEIVLIGHGTGKSSALDFLLKYLKTHHSTIFPQVIATEVADLSALTEPEIEAIAKLHL